MVTEDRWSLCRGGLCVEVMHVPLCIIRSPECPVFRKTSHTVCFVSFRKMKMNRCKTIQWKEGSTIGNEMIAKTLTSCYVEALKCTFIDIRLGWLHHKSCD